MHTDLLPFLQENQHLQTLYGRQIAMVVVIYSRRSDLLCVVFLVWQGPLGILGEFLRSINVVSVCMHILTLAALRPALPLRPLGSPNSAIAACGQRFGEFRPPQILERHAYSCGNGRRLQARNQEIIYLTQKGLFPFFS